MRIAVLGSGYVGLVLAAGLADFGIVVSCLDIDVDKIRQLERGAIPFFEPGLEELVHRNMRRDRLRFSTDIGPAIQDAQVVFVAVGTSAGKDGAADLNQIWAAADQIAQSINEYKVIVIKSTVPVGTSRKLHEKFRLKHSECDVVSNPEFLREGSAVEDFFHPDRTVIGSASERASAVMKEIYRALYLIATPFVFTTWENAELIKYTANSFLATKISFVNEVANLCDAIGASADVHTVTHALGLDGRIGSKFLHPGPGFGGYCFPKDTSALVQIAKSYGQDFKTVKAAIAVNACQFLRIVEKTRNGLGSLDGKVIGVLGLSFKPNTDDIRESRSLMICNALLAGDSSLRVFDPAAMTAARRVLNGPGVHYASDAMQAVEGCDALVVVTEWNEFRNLDLGEVKRIMRGDLLVDAKNIFDVSKAKELGFRYFGMGRS